MRLYVASYGPLNEKCPVLVSYSLRPSSLIASREDADLQCARLNRMQVHVGQHSCEFEVEELDGGEFALACINHPGPDISASGCLAE